MANFESTIEALEHQWMRAWIQRDRKTMKALAARDFIFLLGSEPPAILDRASWLEGAGSRLACTGYRFGSVYIRRHGTTATFASLVTLDATMDRKDWSGTTWVTDLWRRRGIRQTWKLAERTLTRPEPDSSYAPAIRAMQLWK